jgi:hypothetical protein
MGVQGVIYGIGVAPLPMEMGLRIMNYVQDFLYMSKPYQQLRVWSLLVIECIIHIIQRCC